MKLSAIRNFLLLILFIGANSLSALGQKNQEPFKIRKCLLKGNWQLTQTFSSGALHQVKKEEYDGVMRFRCFHRFTEEVNYESNHWIIEGKWRINRKQRTLSLTERNYTQGKMEEHPDDIIFSITQLKKKNWAGSSAVKGQAVKVFYTRIQEP